MIQRNIGWLDRPPCVQSRQLRTRRNSPRHQCSSYRSLHWYLQAIHATDACGEPFLAYGAECKSQVSVCIATESLLDKVSDGYNTAGLPSKL